jgi:hypothetical protein
VGDRDIIDDVEMRARMEQHRTVAAHPHGVRFLGPDGECLLCAKEQRDAELTRLRAANAKLRAEVEAWRAYTTCMEEHPLECDCASDLISKARAATDEAGAMEAGNG